jgi:hypothetical protein
MNIRRVVRTTESAMSGLDKSTSRASVGKSTITALLSGNVTGRGVFESAPRSIVTYIELSPSAAGADIGAISAAAEAQARIRLR